MEVKTTTLKNGFIAQAITQEGMQAQVKAFITWGKSEDIYTQRISIPTDGMAQFFRTKNSSFNKQSNF